MALVNLLKAAYTGKLGQTVGGKWKNKATLRTYAVPTYTDTPAQQTIRNCFRDMSEFVSMFAPQIRQLSALNTKGMTVRNAIVKANKVQFRAGSFEPDELVVSKGGLPQIGTITISRGSGANALTATWTPVAGVTITDRARIIVIGVQPASHLAVVGSELNSAGTMTIPGPIFATGTIHCYAYVLDYRGSARVASLSTYQSLA